MISFFVNIVVIVLVGLLFDKLINTLIFLCSYCPIRQFSGGYNADNYKKCLLVFISISFL